MTLGNYISGDDIYTADGIKEQVLNYGDWAGYYRTPTSFALFSAMGNIDVVKNGKELMNVTTGIARKASLASDTAFPVVGSVVDLDIATKTGSVMVNEQLQVGQVLIFSGYIGTAKGDRATVIARIVAPVGSFWRFKVLHATTGTTTAFDFNSTRGSTFVALSDAKDLGGSAPASSTVYPTQRANWTQLFRHSYGVTEDAASQENLFNDIEMENSKESEDLLYASINNALLFNLAPIKPQQTEGVYVGTGDDSSLMGGLPYLLGCEDLSASQAISHGDNYVAITDLATARAFMTELYNWADKFKNTGGTFYGLTSKAMRAYIRTAALYSATSFLDGKIALPTLDIHYMEIDLGDIKIRLVVDEAFSDGAAPFIYDGTDYLHENLFIFALDMSTVGLIYRNRDKQGIMAPKNTPIEQIRNQFNTENEWTAELTCGMSRVDRNGVFFMKAV